MPYTIAHLTSVHHRFDTRIFIKECQTLAKAGYDVSLVVADNHGDDIQSGIRIYDVGTTSNRLHRILKTTKNVFQKARSLNADIYHLHDPELIPIGLKLKKLGKRVIFDSHEDFPKQILGKTYLNKTIRNALGWSLTQYEMWSCKKFDAIIAATPFIRNKFLSFDCNSIDINNFPIQEELTSDRDWSYKDKNICYIGDISKIRGIQEMVKAMSFVTSGARLQLGGKFSEQSVAAEVKNYRGWSKVHELGFLKRKEVRDTLYRSIAGLVTLHPTINYLDSLPVKMFEYMSVGIPVIASNFTLWREIVEGNACGVCVDPFNPQAIANAIDFFVTHPKKAQEMGKNGQDAVRERYNWLNEEKKLLHLYTTILDTQE